MRIRYSYKNYPYSERATKLSRSLAILSTWPIYLVAWMPLYLPVSLLLISMDMLTDEMNLLLMIVSWVAMYFVLQELKKKGQEKIERIAKEDYIKYQQAKVRRNANFADVGDMFSSAYGKNNFR